MKNVNKIINDNCHNGMYKDVELFIWSKIPNIIWNNIMQNLHRNVKSALKTTLEPRSNNVKTNIEIKLKQL